ncbi:UNVERIFIED_CONTAM: hypothetical protein FKN15_069956 [Acipenser sinensis]
MVNDLGKETDIGTFRTHNGEYFLEPLLKSNGEDYEDEHNKPHLIYRQEIKKEKTLEEKVKPCAASGRLSRLPDTTNTNYFTDGTALTLLTARRQSTSSASFYSAAPSTPTPLLKYPAPGPNLTITNRFNIPHDDSFKCKEAGVKHQYHVMASTLNYNTSPWSWSKCSRKYITEFLERPFELEYFIFTGYGECLLDEPVSRTYELPSQLPGQLYNANKQCELMFGPGSQVCPYLCWSALIRFPSVVFFSQKQCKRLWCTSAEGVHKGCRTQHMPLADGTDCGHGMAIKLPARIYRPKNGGKYCVGRRMKFRSCNTEPCPKGQKDFREEQCSEFDGKHFNINGLPPTVRWIPKYSGILMKDQCKLFCRVAGTTAYYQLKDRVADGTQCGPETNDICVQGLCRVSINNDSYFDWSSVAYRK